MGIRIDHARTTTDSDVAAQQRSNGTGAAPRGAPGSSRATARARARARRVRCHCCNGCFTAHGRSVSPFLCAAVVLVTRAGSNRFLHAGLYTTRPADRSPQVLGQRSLCRSGALPARVSNGGSSRNQMRTTWRRMAWMTRMRRSMLGAAAAALAAAARHVGGLAGRWHAGDGDAVKPYSRYALCPCSYCVALNVATHVQTRGGKSAR